MIHYRAANPEQLGLIVAGFRKKHGLTQHQLGAFVGLSQSAVSEIETNPGKTSVARMFRLLSGLQVDVLLAERHSGHAEETPPEPEW